MNNIISINENTPITGFDEIYNNNNNIIRDYIYSLEKEITKLKNEIKILKSKQISTAMVDNRIQAIVGKLKY